MIRIALLFAGLLLFAMPAGAATKIALEGDTAPGGNGTFTAFGQHGHVTETRHVIFFAATDVTGCIFRYDVDGSNGTALLCNGDPVSLPGGDFWISVGASLDVNGAGDLVFEGLYRDSMGVDQSRVVHRTAAGVLTDLGFPDGSLDINDANDVLIDGLDLHITSPGGSVTPIITEDQALPDDPTIFAADTWGAVGPAGQVAVSVRATPVPSGPPFSDWIIYLWDSGVFTRIGENSFGPFTPSGIDAVTPLFTPGGRLLASMEKDFITDGVVEWNGAEWTPVITPGPGEQIIGSLVTMDTAGLSHISGMSLLAGGRVTPWCAIVGAAPRAREVLLERGDVLPEGTVFSAGTARISTTHWGLQVIFDDLNGPVGIFVGRSNKVPSLGAPAVVALASALAFAGALRLRRGAPRA